VGKVLGVRQELRFQAPETEELENEFAPIPKTSVAAIPEYSKPE